MSIDLINQVEDLKEQVAYWRGMAIDNASNAALAVIADSLELTAAEAWVVGALHRKRGKVVSRIMLQIHSPGIKRGDDRDGNSVEVFITRIRKKCGRDFIITQRCLGYRLSPAGLERVDALIEGLPSC